MNTTKSVYNKLFKEETQLASHNVELGLKEDALNSVKNFEQSYKTVDTEINKFYNQLDAAKKQYESARGEINNLLSFEGKLKAEQTKILAAGKELGIDVTGAPFYKELSAALVRFGNLKEEVKMSENSYKSIKL